MSKSKEFEEELFKPGGDLFCRGYELASRFALRDSHNGSYQKNRTPEKQMEYLFVSSGKPRRIVKKNLTSFVLELDSSNP